MLWRADSAVTKSDPSVFASSRLPSPCADQSRRGEQRTVRLRGTPRSRVAAAGPDPEVSAKATRRRFTPQYKLAIVENAELCETPGEIGKLLRREGLYSSHLSGWRKAAREGSLRELGKKRGPMPSGGKREAKKVRKLERENARLREELRKAHIVIEVQGKVAGLLGLSLGDGKSS